MNRRTQSRVRIQEFDVTAAIFLRKILGKVERWLNVWGKIVPNVSF